MVSGEAVIVCGEQASEEKAAAMAKMTENQEALAVEAERRAQEFEEAQALAEEMAAMREQAEARAQEMAAMREQAEAEAAQRVAELEAKLKVRRSIMCRGVRSCT